MKDKIYATLNKEHTLDCSTTIIGRVGENYISILEITLEESLSNYWLYLDFAKPNGSTYKTSKIDVIENKAIYEIPNALLSERGTLAMQVVLQSENGEVWKSTIKRFTVKNSINATDDIPDQDDFITEAQKVLNEIEEGLTPSIGENGNWYILNKDTGKSSKGLKGDDYIITDEDIEEIENNVKIDMQPILENIENTAKQAETIAKGRATGYVFDTLQDLDLWLQNSENVAKLVLGDNLYIRALGIPDYWWDGSEKQQLETQKVDLTEYATKEYVDVLIGDIEKELGGI